MLLWSCKISLRYHKLFIKIFLRSLEGCIMTFSHMILWDFHWDPARLSLRFFNIWKLKQDLIKILIFPDSSKILQDFHLGPFAIKIAKKNTLMWSFAQRIQIRKLFLVSWAWSHRWARCFSINQIFRYFAIYFVPSSFE